MEADFAETAQALTYGGRPSLAVANPTLAVEWDHEFNGALTPRHVTAGSGQKVGWKCAPHGHHWEATVDHRNNGRGCPTCAGQIVLVGFNDLRSARPNIAAEWDLVANSDLTPEQISVGSNRKVGWKCAAHGHKWEAVISSRAKGRGCPTCAGRIVLAGFNDLRSVRPNIAAEWDLVANGDLTPGRVSISSGKRVSWKCAPHGHPWVAKVSDRTAGSGCGVCAGQIVLAGFNDLGSVRPDIAAEWDLGANGDLAAEQVTVNSGQKVSWRCASHGHPWTAAVGDRTKGNGCPTCAGRIVRAGFNDLGSVRPDIAAEWDLGANGDLSAEQVTVSANQKVGWICAPRGHKWKAVIGARTRGNGCPRCSISQTSKIEQAFFNDLKLFIGDAQNGAKLPTSWGKRKTSSVDIAGTHHCRKVVVEYDGSYWHSTRTATDVEKTEALLADGYLVVRIRENELPHLPIVSENLYQLSFRIPASNTDEQRAELVKPVGVEIMAWLDVAAARKGRSLCASGARSELP